MRKEENTIKIKKRKKGKKMLKKILLIIIAISFTSCASIKEKMPKRKACTGEENNKTLSDILCKK